MTAYFSTRAGFDLSRIPVASKSFCGSASNGETLLRGCPREIPHVMPLHARTSSSSAALTCTLLRSAWDMRASRFTGTPCTGRREQRAPLLATPLERAAPRVAPETSNCWQIIIYG